MNTDETVAGHGLGGRPHAWWRQTPVIATAVAVLVVIGVLVGIAVHSAGQYFVFAPGTAPLVTASPKCKPHGGELALPDGTPCVRLVVPSAKAHAVRGRLLMVDVEVSQASPVDWAEYELGLLGSQRQLVSVVAYAGDTPTSELGCQDTQQMTSANQDAAMAAFRALHYPVKERQLGAQVEAVLSGTPAWNAGIKCNDVITAVDGKPVNSATQFVTMLRRMSPGTTVTLTDRRNGTKTTKQVKVRLAPPPPGLASRAYLGVAVQTMVKPELPFHVSVNAGGIGGPSAGLAFTLAILDTLTAGELTGGHTVAATGTITPDGQVGPVGGLQQKTVAVERAGAQVFFVPATEYRQVKPVASKGLQVVPVSTLSQALQVLKDRYGGRLPQ